MSVELSLPGRTPDERRSELQDYSAFDPRSYLAEYYRSLGPENRFLLRFHHEVYRKLKTNGRLLEFGGGPTVYQLLSASGAMREIVFAEFLECNRRELVKWIFGTDDAVDWTQYIDFVLALEGSDPTADERDEIVRRVSKSVTQIVECDANLPNMLSPRKFNPFDVVSSSFCLECITGDEEKFIGFVSKLSNYLRPGGTLVLALLKNARSYKVGEKLFPVFPLDESYITALLRTLGFSDIDVRTAPPEADQGYAGLIALTAVKD